MNSHTRKKSTISKVSAGYECIVSQAVTFHSAQCPVGKTFRQNPRFHTERSCFDLGSVMVICIQTQPYLHQDPFIIPQHTNARPGIYRYLKKMSLTQRLDSLIWEWLSPSIPSIHRVLHPSSAGLNPGQWSQRSMWSRITGDNASNMIRNHNPRHMQLHYNSNASFFDGLTVGSDFWKTTDSLHNVI